MFRKMAIHMSRSASSHRLELAMKCNTLKLTMHIYWKQDGLLFQRQIRPAFAVRFKKHNYRFIMWVARLYSWPIELPVLGLHSKTNDNRIRNNLWISSAHRGCPHNSSLSCFNSNGTCEFGVIWLVLESFIKAKMHNHHISFISC